MRVLAIAALLALASVGARADGCGGGAVGSNFGACEDATDWHLLTQSQSGTVSINGGLTKTQCDQLRDKYMHVDPASLAEVKAENDQAIARECPKDDRPSGVMWSSPFQAPCHIVNRDGSKTFILYSHTIEPGDIIKAECFE